MHSLVVLVPGDMENRTGGYGYDRRIVAGLQSLGWSIVVHRVGESFPHPTEAARDRVVRLLAALADGTLVLVDGLAFGAMADEAERERDRLRIVALVHHPLASETGLAPDTARRFEQSERRALATARLVIVTSRRTGALLDHYGVPPGRIAVVEPGTDRANVALGSMGGASQFLCVASVVPRKGHETLIDALALLGSLDWRLTCVGSLTRHPESADRLRSKILVAQLADRVLLEGELSEEAVARRYDSADLFVLPTFYEGYGMAVAEALAHGLPVVSTPTGNIPELVADEAGILVPPADATALADALASVITDERLRDRLRAGARRTRDRLPTWDTAAQAMARALDRVAAE